MIYNRFIVCGDSYSEGMSDEMVEGQYRGWASRCRHNGKALRFIYLCQPCNSRKARWPSSRGPVPQALTFVTGKDTLISFHAGANDALRPGYDATKTIALYQTTVRTLAASGATLLLFTVLEDTGNKGKGAEVWKARFSEFNKAVREVGAEVGAIVSDANGLDFFKDNRFLAFDRLHLNEDGHWRVGEAVLEILGYPFNPAWRTPLPPATPEPWIKQRITGVRWFFAFALPWVWRRVRGVSHQVMAAQQNTRSQFLGHGYNAYLLIK